MKQEEDERRIKEEGKGFDLRENFPWFDNGYELNNIQIIGDSYSWW